MFKGSIVAIVTPFTNGAVDQEKLRELVEFQITNGTDAIVPCGTTGESSTLDYDEHMDVVKIVIEQVNKRVPVIAGTGSNSTAEAIELSRKAKEAGADGVLLVTPYYNKPTQEGLVRHYTAIADAVAIPQILYNVPGRTGVNMLPETVARLAPHKNIVAIKEATGSLQQASEILALCGDQIDVLSGDDFITFPMMACGAKGVISVLANIMPKAVADLTDAFFAGDLETARRLHLNTLKISNAMFIESNPIPVKTALGLMGKCSDEVRLPLCPMSEGNKAKLTAIMKEYQLI
ncbi:MULTISPECIES: 4-hydroxy-tetrahydrodipicolinate synthase [Geobacter]|jgi:4-hydroxy-tetrahydrodipicolinate synthase|uniref:4-hydroxy-tetrahydrodipicolinate synthase n=1 Tax=Geobacter sulfurreducens (strain ATCC 51573 / DSM 12127 / PCA) TaxID=243231 RepID=DAPA_GEOSL|nr:4-hydroxy-tetrahydrodipicolinate synthase [Geobacter sulfurreducens]Q74GT6.1 RecName: Full=4-hydroxy-tetrahydrodipicolinate synthase; Short=HTPA synthase [Geobacter sulfurreducens PCA]BET60001.1 4-hydroxy-tetrahydrodipicolinate synthase [Geobacter sp. 60473]AAR33494.1 dihydrodipicolinate synthase [Geobacter sulfurreducens PCA]ADI82998.1 dihydrodipicolinate synthase [Geobacter sulfurreducens KN400]AJY69895.1 dihydrodipicolinate synthase [Geobacter sulfurreducens]UAC04260.1 4-hydroxy-tetrahy